MCSCGYSHCTHATRCRAYSLSLLKMHSLTQVASIDVCQPASFCSDTAASSCYGLSPRATMCRVLNKDAECSVCPTAHGFCICASFTGFFSPFPRTWYWHCHLKVCGRARWCVRDDTLKLCLIRSRTQFQDSRTRSCLPRVPYFHEVQETCFFSSFFFSGPCETTVSRIAARIFVCRHSGWWVTIKQKK